MSWGSFEEWFEAACPGVPASPASYSPSERKHRLLCCAFCRLVFPRIDDRRCRAAVEVAERHADGPSDDELRDASERAYEAAMEALKGEFRSAEKYQLASACTDASRPLPNAFGVEEYVSVWVAQAKLNAAFRDILGGPPAARVAPDSRRTPDVASLATAAYDERCPDGTLDPDRLAVLSDALEEARCDDERILQHLRSPGPHVRGCWALDLILGKT